MNEAEKIANQNIQSIASQHGINATDLGNTAM